MRVRTTHGGTLVLEDLHISVLLLGLGQTDHGGAGWQGGGRGDGSQRRVGRQVRGIDVGPSIDDGDDLCGRQVGQSEIMGCGEGEDVAFAGDRLCSQEQRLEVCSKKGKEVSGGRSVKIKQKRSYRRQHYPDCTGPAPP